MVIVALLPCIFMAMYNTGYQAQKIIAAQGSAFSVADEGLMSALWSGDWRYGLMDMLGVDYTADRGAFMSLGSIIPCLIHGLLYFLPVYLVTMIVGGHCELIFSIIRKHEINEGFLVTGMLFPLTLPPTIPLWQVAIGIAFGVVVGKEIFGGTGKNFLNPALTARAFLYFAYPAKISGDKVWTAVSTGFGPDKVDGFTGATALGQLAQPTLPPEMISQTMSEFSLTQAEAIAKLTSEMSTAQLIEVMPAADVTGSTWMDFFIGNVHGSMGETCTIACLLGAVFLIWTRIGSWRIMAGTVLGMVAFSSLLWALPMSEPVTNISPLWHLVIGGFAFGTVFMATDPVSASMTQTGKWIYGGLIGFMTVLVRSMNPAFPEGIMLAILFANVFAPLIDYYVIQANVKRRLARDGA